MKKSIIFLACIMFWLSPVIAQQTEGKAPIRKIEVVGSAEKEIVPDEIYFSISLKEYKPTTKSKVSIGVLEKELNKAVKKAGIDEEDFQIENVYGWNRNHWYPKKDKQDEEFLASKRYRLKLSNLNKINEILASVDPEGIEYVNIDEYTHSRIEVFRKDLKMEALKAARDKATYLLASIDEKLGPVIEVQEVEAAGSGPYYAMRSSNVAFDGAAESGTNIGFKKIKLQYQIRASFFID